MKRYLWSDIDEEALLGLGKELLYIDILAAFIDDYP